MKSMTVSVAGVKLWNSIKTNITTIMIRVFKKIWKSYFLGEYINTSWFNYILWCLHLQDKWEI